MSIFMGIDYGQKHIGLAIADGPLARPLVSLDMSPNEAISHINKYVVEESVTQIVLGITSGKLYNEIIEFGSSLQVKTGIPVVFHEESLSTKDALAGLRLGGAKKSKLKQDHIYAACLILEDYLELHRQ